MNKIVSIFTICVLSTSAIAATPSTDRRSMATQWGGAQRVGTMSRNQLGAPTKIQAEVVADVPTPVKSADTREKEKTACMNNNIGAGNTFVWASRYSNTGNYASMVEDIEVPENNTCFVRVELKSNDAKINISDVRPVYYEMGRNITCGSWADADNIEQRILDAKKTSRTWGTVAGVVGGAGVGVGAMELFGNKLIGGSVQGQKALNENELLRSQLAVLREKDLKQFDSFKAQLQKLKAECERDIWKGVDAQPKPAGCDINYEALLNL